MFQQSLTPQSQSIEVKAVTQNQFFEPRNIIVRLFSRRDPIQTVISDFPLEPVSVSTLVTIYVYVLRKFCKYIQMYSYVILDAYSPVYAVVQLYY